MTICVLIVAAGKGLRAGTTDRPKQYQVIGERTVLAHTINAFSQNPNIAHIITAIHPDHEAFYLEAVKGCDTQKLCPWLPGGNSRQETVALSLAQMTKLNISHVLIHDGARPFISPQLIERIIASLQKNDVVLPALPVTDTLKYVTDHIVSHTVDRSPLWAAQTPQAFSFPLIHHLHQQAKQKGIDNFTDDIALAEWQDKPVYIVEGESRNTKITTADDLIMADLLMRLKNKSP